MVKFKVCSLMRALLHLLLWTCRPVGAASQHKYWRWSWATLWEDTLH